MSFALARNSWPCQRPINNNHSEVKTFTGFRDKTSTQWDLSGDGSREDGALSGKGDTAQDATGKTLRSQLKVMQTACGV